MKKTLCDLKPFIGTNEFSSLVSDERSKHHHCLTLDTEDEQHALCSFSRKGEVYDAEYLLSYVLEYATYLSLKNSSDSYDDIVNIIEHKRDSFQLFLSVSFYFFLLISGP